MIAAAIFIERGAGGSSTDLMLGNPWSGFVVLSLIGFWMVMCGTEGVIDMLDKKCVKRLTHQTGTIAGIEVIAIVPAVITLVFGIWRMVEALWGQFCWEQYPTGHHSVWEFYRWWKASDNSPTSWVLLGVLVTVGVISTLVLTAGVWANSESFSEPQPPLTAAEKAEIWCQIWHWTPAIATCVLFVVWVGFVNDGPDQVSEATMMTAAECWLIGMISYLLIRAMSWIRRYHSRHHPPKLSLADRPDQRAA